MKNAYLPTIITNYLFFNRLKDGIQKTSVSSDYITIKTLDISVKGYGGVITTRPVIGVQKSGATNIAHITDNLPYANGINLNILFLIFNGLYLFIFIPEMYISEIKINTLKKNYKYNKI